MIFALIGLTINWTSRYMGRYGNMTSVMYVMAHIASVTLMYTGFCNKLLLFLGISERKPVSMLKCAKISYNFRINL